MAKVLVLGTRYHEFKSHQSEKDKNYSLVRIKTNVTWVQSSLIREKKEMTIITAIILILGITSRELIINLASLLASVLIVGIEIFTKYNLSLNTALLILIYVGAIMILFVFVIITVETKTKYKYSAIYKFIPSIIIVLLDIEQMEIIDKIPILENIGVSMFMDYKAINLIGIILVSTLIGTISLLLTV